MTTERMMVACNHININREPKGEPKAIVAVAPSYKSEADTGDGVDALYSSCIDAEEVFGDRLNVPPPNGPGIWVYEQPQAKPLSEDENDWEHLMNGNWRLPTSEEMRRLGEGLSPWKDGRLV